VTATVDHDIAEQREDITMSTSTQDEGTEFAAAARQGRRTVVGELWYYVKLYRSWLVVPILLMLALLGGLVSIGGTGAAPFIYALF
jgi:hypothetical protein